MMTKEQEKIALQMVEFMIKHDINVYDNMITIPIETGEEIEFQNIIENFNHNAYSNAVSLPVIIQDNEQLGRLFVQYTNQNFVSGYKSLETNKVFRISEDEYLSTSGNTIKESLSALYKKVHENISKFTSVTYSEDNELNSL